jgi:hypothetical protein
LVIKRRRFKDDDRTLLQLEDHDHFWLVWPLGSDPDRRSTAGAVQ